MTWVLISLLAFLTISNAATAISLWSRWSATSSLQRALGSQERALDANDVTIKSQFATLDSLTRERDALVKTLESVTAQRDSLAKAAEPGAAVDGILGRLGGK